MRAILPPPPPHQPKNQTCSMEAPRVPPLKYQLSCTLDTSQWARESLAGPQNRAAAGGYKGRIDSPIAQSTTFCPAVTTTIPLLIPLAIPKVVEIGRGVLYTLYYIASTDTRSRRFYIIRFALCVWGFATTVNNKKRETKGDRDEYLQKQIICFSFLLWINYLLLLVCFFFVRKNNSQS